MTVSPPSSPALAGIQTGTPAFRRVSLALFAAGFATFALLYHVQPLLPLLASTFKVAPAESALALSLATGFLSVSLLLSGALADLFGRKPVMVASLALSALLTLVTAIIPSWHGLLLARALFGVTLAGLPAVAMAYLGEEMDPAALDRAMGLYIAGSAMGGMAGRLVTGVLVDFLPWQMATIGIGLLGLASAAAVWRFLPVSVGFVRRPSRPGSLLRALAAPLAQPDLRLLFMLGFLLMGGFITIFNYMGFRLLLPPFDLPQSVVGLIFGAYLLGMGSSSSIGQLTARWGRSRVMAGAVLVMAAGVGLTVADSLYAVVPGIGLMTFGFFGAHSIASGWVGALAPTSGKAQSSSLYLFSYYMGSSLIGVVGGVVWTSLGWGGLVALVSAMLVLSLTAIGLLSRARQM
ncbi:MFS transporter [Niveispirillum lacus]|uniref:MFS transporter n=1 Tax=Niveispirillum lacus TaxID=1981099 RepID=A0A255Z7G3_9PROT|nr:MFS transporter [Niveispirillum lacus]OYQ37362.1 MFS transporter [Niveispirillum lacus]